jgi:hypothetical protein
MERFHLRDKVRMFRLTKTKDFWKMEQLTNFMVQHLYELYDQAEELEDYSHDWDYVIGGIDTTQVYLLKSGVEFLTHDQYIEKVENAKWVKA